MLTNPLAHDFRLVDSPNPSRFSNSSGLFVAEVENEIFPLE